MDWTDKVALITGGSAGIGLAIAEQIVGRGGRVALVARGKPALDAAIGKLGPERAVAFEQDVSDLAALTTLPARVVARMGRLDAVFNNAGLNYRGNATLYDAEKLGQIVHVNLTAPIVLTRVALEHLKEGAAIVNIASLAGFTPLPEAATYSATKVGLRFFSVALGIELEARGIHVAVVSPGPVDTGFFGALSKVPAIVFSQPMSTASEVATLAMKAIDERLSDVAIPAASGKLATMGYLFPRLARWLRPKLIARGERNKAAYIASKGQHA